MGNGGWAVEKTDEQVQSALMELQRYYDKMLFCTLV